MTQITAAKRTIIATGRNSAFPVLAESKACQRFVDLLNVPAWDSRDDRHADLLRVKPVGLAAIAKATGAA